MCEGKTPGFFARQSVYAQGRRAAAQQPSCTCHQPAPEETPAGYAQKVLWTAGGIVLLASAGAILRAVAAGAVVIAGLVVLATAAGGGWLLWRRVRSLREVQYIPAPLPQPSRTMVTGVSVQAIEQPAGSIRAVRRAGSKVRP